MEYLKLFDTEDNYLAYRNDKSKYIKPNVSLCEGGGVKRCIIITHPS